VEVRGHDDWSAVCRLLGHPDPCGAAGPTAVQTAALLQDLQAWALVRTPWQAASLLQRAGVSAAPVQDGEDVWRDPQLRARGSIVAVEHPDLGTHEYAAPPHRMGRTPARIRRPAPRLGEDTRYVLSHWLGIPDAEVEALVRSGVVATDDARPAER
jgi:benzylsuccinate CoA-transferase BbsF subunit